MSNKHERCEGCPYRGRSISFSGPLDSQYAIVGESPGGDEIRKGEPFVGPSGEILWSAIERVSNSALTRDDFLVMNSFNCRPVNKDDKQRFTDAILACRPSMIANLSLHPKRLIFALGNAALWSLTGNFDLKITQVRGQLLDLDPNIAMPNLSDCKVVPVVHPAALMRGTGTIRQFRADLEYGLDLVGATNGGTKRVFKEPEESDIVICESSDDLAPLQNASLIAADIETSGFSFMEKRILSVGLQGDTDKRVFIIPWSSNRDPLGTVTEARRRTLETLRELLEDTSKTFIWHNGKFDVKFLRRGGIKARVDQDTMLMSYALDPTRGIHDLETVGIDWLRAPSYKNMLDPYLPNKKASYEVIPTNILYKYQAIDVALTNQVYSVLNEALNGCSRELYNNILIPAAEMLIRVEMKGLSLDLEMLRDNETRIEGRLFRLNEELTKLVGKSININSPQQLSQLLFDDLQLKAKLRNTRADNLKDIQHPVMDIVREYRVLNKQVGTYIRGLRKVVQFDNRIYSQYNLHGTVTGRLSSSDPNLQNIPRDSTIRDQFKASEGCYFVEFDFSQAELRSLAALSGDPTLLEIYNSNERSLHKEVAEKMYGEGYTPDQYVRAKGVNFGIVYGRQARSLMDEYNITKYEAQRIIDEWFEMFPVAYAFIQKCRNAPLKSQTITTIFGRRKKFGVVSRQLLNDIQNEASNFPHQSIASDITLWSAMRLMLDKNYLLPGHSIPREKRLDAFGCSLVNLVHDSILLEVPNDTDFDSLHAVVKETMESTAPLWGITSVPFTIDCKVGERWGSLKEV